METFSKFEQILRGQSHAGASPAIILADEGTPTTSIAILDEGKISSRCISTEGNNEETLFQACSISKPVAGVVMAILVQQGKANFDSKIVDYLPASIIQRIETPSTIQLVKKITIEMLMSHTSGLSVHGFPGYVDDIPSNLDILNGKSGVNTQHVHLNGFPGQRYSYSGGGITVLQLLMEHITQQAFPDIIQELILKPLEMHRSFYDVKKSDRNFAKAHYTGYTPCDVPYRTNPEQAAAGLWTTPTDLLKLVRALQVSLNSDEGILKQDIARYLLTEVSSTMALAWFAPQDPGIVFAHAGDNDPGWCCLLVGYADLQVSNSRKENENWRELSSGCGIAVMTNSALGSKICWKVVNAIANIKGWSAVPEMAIKPAVTVSFAALDLPLHPAWEEWIGDWSDGWQIGKNKDGDGIAIFGNLPAVKLLPAATPVAKYSDATSVDVLLEGLEIMMRLGTDKEGKFIQICDGGNGKCNIIRP